MNWQRIEGTWNEVKGRVRSKWGKLIDNDVDLIGGKLDQLVARLQQRYGHTREQAEREIDDFIKSVPSSSKSA